MSIGDKWWSKLKNKHPNLKYWDLIFDQSHLHHTLTILLAYGGIGAIAGILLPWFSFSYGLAYGIWFGLARYVVREGPAIIQAIFPKVAKLLRINKNLHRGSLWDGVLDVLFPAFVLLPHTLSILNVSPQTTSIVQYTLGAMVAYLYSFGRPKGIARYGE